MKAFLLRLTVFAALFVLPIAWSVEAASVQESDDSLEIIPEEGMQPSRQGLDVSQCLRCHKMTEKEAKNPNYERKTRELIAYNEIPTWNFHDLHRNAFLNIKPGKTAGRGGNPNLAWKMQEVLRQSPNRGPTYEVAKAAECLACHAVDTSWDPKQGTTEAVVAGALDKAEDPRFDIRYGVSCEACHGIVSDAWNTQHQTPKWRTTLPSDKLKLSQVDLRDPRTKAERCTSCHVGSAAEGKFVTHEMYAAGHPPLPTFEIAAYMEQQPAHWLKQSQTSYFQQELAKEKAGTQKKDTPDVYARYHYREGEHAEVRALAYDAAVRLRATCQLLAKDSANGGMLDFSHFDCAACHHDLKLPSERQSRSGGITGRPTMKLQTDLLDLVLANACTPTLGDEQKAKEAEAQLQTLRASYEQKLGELKGAFVARPFGDSKQIKQIAGELSAITDQILQALEPIRYNDARTRQLLDALLQKLEANHKKGGSIDHDNAQELAWAALVLHGALENDRGGKYNPVEQWNAINSAIGVVLRDPSTRPMPSVELRLGSRLKTQYSFESDKFYEAMKSLAPNKP